MIHMSYGQQINVSYIYMNRFFFRAMLKNNVQYNSSRAVQSLLAITLTFNNTYLAELCPVISNKMHHSFNHHFHRDIDKRDKLSVKFALLS